MEVPVTYTYRNRDAAKRFADEIATYQTVIGATGILQTQFVAVELAEGYCHGPYDSRDDAWRHCQNLPSRIFIWPIPLERFGPETADVLLWYVRQCYDNGWREDPRFGLILPTMTEDLGRVL